MVYVLRDVAIIKLYTQHLSYSRHWDSFDNPPGPPSFCVVTLWRSRFFTWFQKKYAQIFITMVEWNPEIMVNLLCPGKSYCKMYEKEPRYNNHG